MSDQSTAVSQAAAATYLARVRHELADLPPGELEEILEDVAPHLAEVAAELGTDTTVEQLIDRLGTPENYGRDLRAAVGVQQPVTGKLRDLSRRHRLLARLALWGMIAASVAGLGLGLVIGDAEEVIAALLVVAVSSLVVGLPYLRRGSKDAREVLDLPEVVFVLRAVARVTADGKGAQFLSYLRSLQPGWWLIRAALVAVVLVGAYNRGGRALLVLVLLTVPLAFASIWLGRRASLDRRLWWVVMPANALVLGVGLFALQAQRDSPEIYYATPSGDQGLTANGELVRNVYVFDAAGNPIRDVYLYDHNGTPIEVVDDYCAYSDAAAGLPVRPKNNVPKPLVDGPSGCVLTDQAPFTVAIPKAGAPTAPPPVVPEPTPTSTPSPSPSVSPSPMPTASD